MAVSRLGTVIVLCLRVVEFERTERIDLMRLESIQLGFNTFRFNEESTDSELILRSC